MKSTHSPSSSSKSFSRFSPFAGLALVIALLPACGSSGTSPGGGADGAPAGTPDSAPPGTPDAAPPGTPDAAPHAGPDAAPGEDLDMKASDFECVLRWDKVGGYRVTNKLGHDALSVAKSATGGTFPVGTIVQIVPQEAMVKRRAGFSAASHDWEFFALTVSKSGTTIDMRGATTPSNAAGSCLGCHNKAMPQWDLVCATTHGCDPLPLSESILVSIQNSDPRCP